MGVKTQKKMKRLIFITTFILLLSAYSASAQKVKEAAIEFTETIHNYDTIQQGKEAVCYFYYKNSGNSPLVLYNAFSSCGCTIPKWNAKPLPPGKSDKIKVVYNAGNEGSFQKTIVVKSNAKNEPQKVLRIKGYVKK